MTCTIEIRWLTDQQSSNCFMCCWCVPTGRYCCIVLILEVTKSGSLNYQRVKTDPKTWKIIVNIILGIGLPQSWINTCLSALRAEIWMASWKGAPIQNGTSCCKIIETKIYIEMRLYVLENVANYEHHTKRIITISGLRIIPLFPDNVEDRVNLLWRAAKAGGL
jgi:hypothetical protein